MEISNELLLAHPLANNTGWSWTLASRLGYLLERAQQQFGPRDTTYTPVGIEFTVNRAGVWFPGNCRNIVIQLKAGCANDTPQACYQLAQECIHLLSPTGGSHANYLEEGLSIVFATRYVAENFGFQMIQPSPKYSEAAHLVETFLGLDNEAVRKVRIIQPSFSQITVANLVQACPTCPPELAERLLENF
jgi:hypothetical protein